MKNQIFSQNLSNSGQLMYNNRRLRANDLRHSRPISRQ